MIDEKRIAEWKALVNEAPAGPWRGNAFAPVALGASVRLRDAQGREMFVGGDEDLPALAFIIAAREAVPALLAERDELRREIRSFSKSLDLRALDESDAGRDDSSHELHRASDELSALLE